MNIIKKLLIKILNLNIMNFIVLKNYYCFKNSIYKNLYLIYRKIIILKFIIIFMREAR